MAEQEHCTLKSVCSDLLFATSGQLLDLLIQLNGMKLNERRVKKYNIAELVLTICSDPKAGGGARKEARRVLDKIEALKWKTIVPQTNNPLQTTASHLSDEKVAKGRNLLKTTIHKSCNAQGTSEQLEDERVLQKPILQSPKQVTRNTENEGGGFGERTTFCESDSFRPKRFARAGDLSEPPKMKTTFERQIHNPIVVQHNTHHRNSEDVQWDILESGTLNVKRSTDEHKDLPEVFFGPAKTKEVCSNCGTQACVSVGGFLRAKRFMEELRLQSSEHPVLKPKAVPDRKPGPIVHKQGLLKATDTEQLFLQTKKSIVLKTPIKRPVQKTVFKRRPSKHKLENAAVKQFEEKPKELAPKPAKIAKTSWTSTESDESSDSQEQVDCKAKHCGLGNSNDPEIMSVVNAKTTDFGGSSGERQIPKSAQMLTRTAFETKRLRCVDEPMPELITGTSEMSISTDEILNLIARLIPSMETPIQALPVSFKRKQRQPITYSSKKTQVMTASTNLEETIKTDTKHYREVNDSTPTPVESRHKSNVDCLDRIPDKSRRDKSQRCKKSSSDEAERIQINGAQLLLQIQTQAANPTAALQIRDERAQCSVTVATKQDKMRLFRNVFAELQEISNMAEVKDSRELPPKACSKGNSGKSTSNDRRTPHTRTADRRSRDAQPASQHRKPDHREYPKHRQRTHRQQPSVEQPIHTSAPGEQVEKRSHDELNQVLLEILRDALEEKRKTDKLEGVKKPDSEQHSPRRVSHTPTEHHIKSSPPTPSRSREAESDPPIERKSTTTTKPLKRSSDGRADSTGKAKCTLDAETTETSEMRKLRKARWQQYQNSLKQKNSVHTTSVERCGQSSPNSTSSTEHRSSSGVKTTIEPNAKKNEREEGELSGDSGDEKGNSVARDMIKPKARETKVEPSHTDRKRSDTRRHERSVRESRTTPDRYDRRDDRYRKKYDEYRYTEKRKNDHYRISRRNEPTRTVYYIR